MINDPEKCCGPALLGRLSRFGTVCSAGRKRARLPHLHAALWRWCQGHRTSLMYYLHDVSEERLYADMGIQRPKSRATGIMKDERLDRVKE